MESADLRDFFFRAKPINVLLALAGSKKEWFASSLAKEVDCTFPHIIKILSKLASFGLVSFHADGRRKLVFLTAKGRRISQAFSLSIASLEG
jgi:predicted transcriptional regulator